MFSKTIYDLIEHFALYQTVVQQDVDSLTLTERILYPINSQNVISFRRRTIQHSRSPLPHQWIGFGAFHLFTWGGAAI